MYYFLAVFLAAEESVKIETKMQNLVKVFFPAPGYLSLKLQVREPYSSIRSGLSIR